MGNGIRGTKDGGVEEHDELKKRKKKQGSESGGSIKNQVFACYTFLSLDTLHYLNTLNLTDIQFQKILQVEGS